MGRPGLEFFIDDLVSANASLGRLRTQAEPGFSLKTLLNQGETARVPFSLAGGVNVTTIASVQRAGAQVAVAGGAIYGATDPAAAARELRAAII
jgi:3-hexulose-6-phosphate synthase